jgi:hypothetical protein
MNFQYDLYISYSIYDNKPLPERQGWVTNFQHFLVSLLNQILNKDVNVLSYPSQEKPSLEELKKVKAFIVLVSPEYILDEDCLEEVDSFFEDSIKKGNLFINGKERIFKVVKYPVAYSEQPSKISNLLEYALYDIDTNTNEPVEFSDFFNVDAQRKFWLKMVDLAYDISEVLKAKEGLNVNHAQTTTYNDKNIYLAEVGYDLQLIRDNIKRELQRHGFRVLPDHTHPINATELELSIKKDLSRSRMSIHLIGDSYGELAPNSDKSILDIQNSLAAEHAIINGRGKQKFSRLIWISPDAKLLNDKQRLFVENLRREVEDSSTTEILQSPIEDFKIVVLDELFQLNINNLTREITRANNALAENTNNKERIYFIFDKIDSEQIQPIIEYFKFKNYEVLLPKFDGQLLELRELHIHNLRICDHAIVYADRVNKLWIQMKILDLMKAPGLGRTKNELNKAVLLGRQFSGQLDSQIIFDVPIIKEKESVEDILNQFLNTINL